MNYNQVGIVSIATNKYIEFYFNLINSFKENCLDFSSITFYLFTDRIHEARQYILDKDFKNIVIMETPNLGWPDATLLRYKIFHEHKEIFTTEILVYLDSDMLILKDPLLHFKQADTRMTFVRHPGYYFEFSLRFIKFLARNPKKFLSFVISLIRIGGIGSWENRRLYAAYVPRALRKKYFCGGIWFARRFAFLEFCHLLSEKNTQELEENRIPIWHDESYLNWFASGQTHNELSPLFCSDEIVDKLFTEKPYLRAVHKPIAGYHGK